MIYKARKGQVTYGEAIGIIIMDTYIPIPPGAVGNATTYPFPVRFRVVKEASIEKLVKRGDPTLLQPFVEAGWDLVREGVRGIAGNCGFMVLFQDELAKELPVPVFMSSLLQIPFISRMLRPGEKVGIISADSASLTERHLQIAGVNDATLVRVVGLENQKHFYDGVSAEKGELHFEKVEEEVVETARGLVEEDEKVKAILLECSDLPPYAAAVQEAVHLPVFDFITMINYVFSSLVRERFEGYM